MSKSPEKSRALRKTLIIASALVALFAAAAAGSQPAQAPAPWPAKVRLLFLPVYGHPGTVTKYEPLRKHLQQVLGVPVESSSADDYEAVLLRMGRGDYDIAYLGASTLVKAVRLSQAEVIAMELDDQKRRGYYSVIIARTDHGYQSLNDVRGKTIAFSDPDSTSGFQIPLTHFIRDLQTTPAAFAGKVVFAGSHREVIMGVYNGAFDAGATNNIDLERARAEVGIGPDVFQTLWQSKLIPGSPVCVRADLPPSFKAAVLGALISMNHETKSLANLKIGGYGMADLQDYEVFMENELIGQ